MSALQQNTMLNEPFSTVCLHHAPMRWLEARIRTSNADHVGTFLFDEFAEALAEHLQCIDAVLMPVLQTHDLTPVERQYVDAHWYLKRNLAALKAMDRRGDLFRKRLWAVMRQLEHQMTLESTELPYLVGDQEPAAPLSMPRPMAAHAGH
jgi:hypothetical protein